MDFYLFYQQLIYIILHYGSLWTILTCIIAASISWRLFTIISAQQLQTEDAYLAWWTTAIWGFSAITFFLIGLIFT